MKDNFFLAALIALSVHAHGQPPVSPGPFNHNTGTASGVPKSTPAGVHDTQQIKCQPKTFYSVDASGQVLQWELSSGAITFLDTVFATSPVTSIAVCNALSGSGASPTFYGDATNNSVAYYDGLAWVVAPVTPPLTFFNGGGFGNDLYFENASYSVLYKYDGINMTQLFQFAGRQGSSADLAVDDLGNIWMPTGPNPFTGDQVTVISPAGTVLYNYTLSQTYTTNHCYGCFLMDGVMYLGFGSSNPVYPNMLLPITFNGTMADVGTPIPFPNSDFYDLAGCNPGDPIALAVASPEEALQGWLYPSPASGYLTVKNPRRQPCTFKVFDHLGKPVCTSSLEGAQSLVVDVHPWPAGAYFVLLEGDGWSEDRTVSVTR